MQIERLKYGDCTVYMLTHNGEVIGTICSEFVPSEPIEKFIANKFAEEVRDCKVVDAGNVTKCKFYEAQLKAKSKNIEKILEVLD